MSQAGQWRVIGLIGIVLTVLMSGQSLQAPAATDFYNQGKTSYKAGRYEYAVKHFSAALQNNPANPYAHFYLGLSYARLKQPDKARAAFERVIEIENMKKFAPGGLRANQSLIDKAQKNIAVMTKSQMTAQGNAQKASAVINLHAAKKDNYLANAIPNGQIIHWDPSRMPLKVYIQSGQGIPGWNPVYNKEVTSAMAEWSRASAGKVSFRQVYNKSDADILVNWRREFSHQKVGVNAFRQAGGTIVQSDVHLATHHPAGYPLSPGEIRGTALHEFGHALGIQGHSPYPGDILFFSQNPTQGSNLSARDQKTLQLLYEQKADVTNNTGVSTSKTKNVYQLLQKANDLLVADPSQALTYLQQARQIDPNNRDTNEMMALARYNVGVGCLNDGVAAAKRQNKTLARSKFEQAVDIFEALARSSSPPAGTHQNLASARHNLGLVSQ